MFVNAVAQTDAAAGQSFDIFTLLLPLALGLLIFMMFRKQRKMQKQVKEQRTQMMPGTEVMTSFGLFGTILSIDDESNKAILELSPGNTATVHTQALTKVVSTTDADTVEDRPTVVPDDASSLTAQDAPAPERGETPEETVDRLDRENKRDDKDN